MENSEENMDVNIGASRVKNETGVVKEEEAQ